MTSPEDYMLPCLWKKTLNIDCMGCGTQRAISLILHGDFLEAFYMYPAIYSLIILLGFITINTFKNYKYGNKIILTLALLNGIIIVSNFILKTFLIN